mgnify:CR=1 FL=1
MTKKHRIAIKKALKLYVKERADKVLFAVSPEGKPKIFLSCASAARAIGCSTQLVSFAARSEKTGIRKALGWKLEWRYVEDCREALYD